jgi:hypothetical protein
MINLFSFLGKKGKVRKFISLAFSLGCCKNEEASEKDTVINIY